MNPISSPLPYKKLTCMLSTDRNMLYVTFMYVYPPRTTAIIVSAATEPTLRFTSMFYLQNFVQTIKAQSTASFTVNVDQYTVCGVQTLRNVLYVLDTQDLKHF